MIQLEMLKREITETQQKRREDINLWYGIKCNDNMEWWKEEEEEEN